MESTKTYRGEVRRTGLVRSMVGEPCLGPSFIDAVARVPHFDIIGMLQGCASIETGRCYARPGLPRFAEQLRGNLVHRQRLTTARYMHRVNSVQMAAQAKFLDAIKVMTAAS